MKRPSGLAGISLLCGHANTGTEQDRTEMHRCPAGTMADAAPLNTGGFVTVQKSVLLE